MPTYSHSRLNTFENCPLKYRFQYVDKIGVEPEGEGIEAFLGSRVHETLEKLYKDLKTGKTNTLEDLIQYFEEIWAKNWHPRIIFVKPNYTEENYKQIGRQCITDYYNHYQPFNDGKTIALEYPVLIHLDKNGKYILRGFIDRLTQLKNGVYEIHDYKTSGYMPTQADLESNRQLALYNIGIQNLWKDVKKVDLVWHYMVFDKEIRSTKTKTDLNKLKVEVIKIIQKVEKATKDNDFPRIESKLCDWCDYKALCPSWAHIVKTELMPINEYMKDKGVDLVNKYSKLVEEKREFLEKVDTELQKLGEAILAYAKKEGVDVIRGNDRKLKIKIVMKTKFPTKTDDPEKRRELDDLLKKSGHWIEVSELSLSNLSKIVEMAENGEIEGWNKRLVEKVKAYQTLQESTAIYMSVLKEE